MTKSVNPQSEPATKADIVVLQSELVHVKSELKAEIVDLKLELKTDIAKLDNRVDEAVEFFMDQMTEVREMQKEMLTEIRNGRDGSMDYTDRRIADLRGELIPMITGKAA